MSETESEATVSLQRESCVEQFCAVTGSNPETARATLEACGWNLELAINMQMDSIEPMDPMGLEPPLLPPPPPRVFPAAPTSASSAAGLGLGLGPVPGPGPTNLSTSSSQAMQHPASSTASRSSDDVRPPIPPVRQVLVDDGFNHAFRARPSPQSVFDSFRDFQAEARWQEELRAQDPDSLVVGSSKRRTLEDLFRPPLDLLFRGSMDAAREQGVRENKWLMINVQNVQEFSCQVLNRDVWSNPAVKSIICEHFVFWQVYHDSSDGQRYMQFYNVMDFPYVAILDPRTGEKLRSWTTIDQVTFCDLVTEFLMEHPTPTGIAGRPAELVTLLSNNSTNEKTIYEESEELQLKAAIAASLQEAPPNHVNSRPVPRGADDNYESDDLETFDSDTEETPTGAAIGQTSSKVQETKVKTVEEPMVSESYEEKGETEESAEDWRKYLGHGSNLELVLRFPDGKREQISFPADSKLKAVYLYISSKGYGEDDYDLVTNFPRKNLHDFPSDSSLQSVGLSPRETLYIQHKS